MRCINLLMCCALLGAVWSSEAAAELFPAKADGWHTWQIDHPSSASGTMEVYVQLTDGQPQDIRVLSTNCSTSTPPEAVDHGLVSSEENLIWLRTVVEDRSLDHDVREDALFALVLSESDEAYDYIDRLLSQR